MPQHLTCGFSKVEFWWEVEACSLFLENFQMRVIQCPRLCCRKRKEETKDNGNVKTFIEINNCQIGFWHIGVQKKSCELTEEVQVSAFSGFPVGAPRHRGVCPDYAVRAGHQVLPIMLMSGGVEVNY